MKKNILPVALLCGALAASLSFTGCTKDYDDDLQEHRTIIETNATELKQTIKDYQTQVDNKLNLIEQAYKNADATQQTQLDEAKAKLTQLQSDLKTAENTIADLKIDQTSLASLVETYKSAIDADIKSITNDVDVLNSTLTTVADDVEALQAFQTKAVQSIEKLETASSEYKQDIADLKEKAQNAATEIASLKTSQENLKSTMETADKALDQRVSDLKSTLSDEVTKLTGTITDQNTTLTGMINTLSASVDTKETGLRSEIADALADAKTTASEALDTYKKMIDTEVATISTQVADVVVDLGELSAKHDALSTKVDGIESDLTTLTSNHNALYTQVTGLETSISEVSSALSDYKDEVTKLLAKKVDLTTYNKQIKTIQTTISNTETSLKNYTDKAVENAINGLTGEDGAITANTDSIAKVANDLNTFIKDFEDTIMPEITASISALGEGIEALANRLTSASWAPSVTDEHLTLNVTTGTDKFTKADLTEYIVVTTRADEEIDEETGLDGKDLSSYLKDSISVTAIFNQVGSRAVVDATMFGTPKITEAKKVKAGVYSAKVTFTKMNLTQLYKTLNGIATNKTTNYQVKLVLTDKHDLTVATEFASIYMKK